jgi:glycosyltransferase involved in cell wall biosynthesis
MSVVIEKEHLRIAQLSGDPPSHLGGVGRDVRILREGLISRGHLVESLSPRVNIGDLKLSAIAMKNFVDYDLVHVHGPTPFLSDLVCFNRSIARLVLTFHSENEWISHSISRAYLALHKLIHNRTAKVIVETSTYRERYKSRSNAPEIIPPPGPQWESPASTLSQKNHKFTVVFVGQFRPYKGIGILLKAAEEMPSIQFVFCGRGRLDWSLREAVTGRSNVIFRGALDEADLQDAYRSAHVVCLPSLNTSEAFGVSLLEGATCGAFPVGSALPGVTEHVESLEGETFPSGDVRSLVSALKRLSENRDYWARRAIRSMDRAAEYNRSHTPEWYCTAHEALFTRVVNRG